MQAIILAGGFGTRLQNVVSNIPKPMAPIRGIPFLSFILEQLNKKNFDKIVLAVGYKGEKIENFYGDNYKNLKLRYSYEDSPLGTGGCVKKALSLIEDDYVFVINGDTYFDVDFNSIQKSKNLTIACKYMNDASRYGKVIFDDDQIIKEFQEKKSNNFGYINGGIYFINTNIFDDYKVEEKFSIEKDFFETYLCDLKIKAHISDGYFIDIGIPEDYERAQNELFLK
jgi:D-glycero-alpha-D-manno-heptose 1-phosphate guanylyltransferase